jgi:hypothetical protein
MPLADQATSYVRVTFETERMPHSTELKRLLRAVDSLYYALLFAGEERYAGQAEVWHSWVKLGFATGLQEGPPGASEADRIRINTFSNSKELTFTVFAGSPSTVKRWIGLLNEIDEVRPELGGLEREKRVELLLADDVVRSQLADPVSAATASGPAEDAEHIDRAIRTALGALSYPIVKACRVSESA